MPFLLGSSALPLSIAINTVCEHGFSQSAGIERANTHKTYRYLYIVVDTKDGTRFLALVVVLIPGMGWWMS